jgi:hypothetical protein
LSKANIKSAHQMADLKKNKTALVDGAGRKGIGKAITLAL